MRRMEDHHARFAYWETVKGYFASVATRRSGHFSSIYTKRWCKKAGKRSLF